jgi:hypothetical protein
MHTRTTNIKDRKSFFSKFPELFRKLLSNNKEICFKGLDDTHNSLVINVQRGGKLIRVLDFAVVVDSLDMTLFSVLLYL